MMTEEVPSVLRALAAILTTFAAGLGVSALVLRGRVYAVTGLIGMSLVLGMAFVSVALFLLSFFFSGWVLVEGLTVVLLLLGCFGVVHFIKHKPVFSKTDGGFVVLAIIQCVAAAWFAFAYDLGGDGLVNFEIRARLMFEHAGQIPLAFFNDPSRSWLHPRYPLFIPMNEAWFYLRGGVVDQVGVKWLAVPMALAASCIYYNGIEILTGSKVRGVIASAMFVLVPGIFAAPGGVIWMWGDFALGLFFLAATLELLLFLKDKQRSVIPFAIYAGFLPWVKTEGAILGGCLLVVHGILTWRASLIRRSIVAAFPYLIVFAGWKVFCLAVGAKAPNEFLPPSIDLVAQNYSKIFAVIWGVLRELVEVKRWSLLWLLALLALFRLSRSGMRVQALVVCLLIGVPLACYCGAFFLNPRPYYLNALPRLLIPLGMIAISAIAVAFPLREKKEDSVVNEPLP